jgi:DNA-binding CsgD family transcriptional regulator
VPAAWRQHALALRAHVIVHEGRLVEGRELAEPLLDEPDIDERVWLVATLPVSSSFVFGGQTTAGLGVVDRAMPVAVERMAELPWAVREVANRQITGLMFAGRLAEVESLLGGYYELATGLHDNATMGQIRLMEGAVAQLRGHCGSARVALRGALDLFRTADPTGFEGLALALLSCTEALGGDVAAALRAREDALVAEGSRGGDKLYEAAFFATDVHLAGAAGEWTRAGEVALDRAERLAAYPVLRANLLHLAVTAGLPPGPIATLLCAIAEPAESELVRAFADHATALADRDALRVEEVASRFEDLTCTLFAAEAAAQASGLYRAEGRTDSARRMAAHANRLAALCEGARSRPLVDLEPMPLSAREREAAALAAQGLTNVEIAARLVLSVRTVESHVYRACVKLGISGRDELAPFFAQSSPKVQ